MKVGFTGTRKGMSSAQQGQLRLVLYLTKEDVDEFHHGAAVGADCEAADIVARIIYSVSLVPHPAGADPLARNRDIVDACDVLIAAPLHDREEQRSGTWATIRYAQRSMKPVVMLSRGQR